MSGWIIAFAFAFITATALVTIGKLPRNSWTAIAAAAVLALAGYAYQGRPDIAGAPANAAGSKSNNAESLILMRSKMDRSFSSARPYLILSDAYARDGDYQLGAAYINSGIRRNPKNADLWAGLAVQLLLAGEGQMSAPAIYAFDQARKLSPRQPVPDYFEGLNALYAGDVDKTIGLWQAVLDRAPKEAKYKTGLENQLKGLLELKKAVFENAELRSQIGKPE